jgi:hypothetical protein
MNKNLIAFVLIVGGVGVFSYLYNYKFTKV